MGFALFGLCVAKFGTNHLVLKQNKANANIPGIKKHGGIQLNTRVDNPQPVFCFRKLNLFVKKQLVIKTEI